MNSCLVTKLLGSVENPDLPILGGFTLKFDAGVNTAVTIRTTENISAKCDGSGFMNAGRTETIGNTIEGTVGVTNTTLQISSDVTNVVFYNDDLTAKEKILSVNANVATKNTIGDYSYMPALESLEYYGPQSDIADLKGTENITSIKTLALVGNLDAQPFVENLIYINSEESNIVCSFDRLTGITAQYIYVGPNMKGEITKIPDACESVLNRHSWTKATWNNTTRTKGMALNHIDFGNTLDSFLTDIVTLTKVVGGSDIRGTVTANTASLAQSAANYAGAAFIVNGVRYNPQI